MRASSVRTLATMVAAVDKDLGKASEKDGTQVAEELFALSDLFDSNIRLTRNLSDPARTAADKQALVTKIFQGKLSAPVLDGVMALAAGRWSTEADLGEAARILGKHVLLKTAQDNGKLDDVERDIFAMGQVIGKNRELRNFLTDSHRAPANERIETFNKLIGEKVEPLALRLVDAVIERALPGHLGADIRALLDSAAQLRSRAMATIYTATPLSDTQQSRLVNLLSKRAGHDVVVNVVVDPSLIGGVKIRRGDVVVDGAVSTRAAEFRRKLAS